jgi:hypothetical protein
MFGAPEQLSGTLYRELGLRRFVSQRRGKHLGCKLECLRSTSADGFAVLFAGNDAEQK